MRCALAQHQFDLRMGQIPGDREWMATGAPTQIQSAIKRDVPGEGNCHGAPGERTVFDMDAFVGDRSISAPVVKAEQGLCSARSFVLRNQAALGPIPMQCPAR